MVSDEYAKLPAQLDRTHHLAALHNGWATPLAAVEAAAAETAGTRVLDVRRVVAGEQNEVYDVSLDGAPSLIVRISHRGPAAHEREAWVLQQCASRGIPGPRIRLLRAVAIGAESCSMMVMEKLPGERLCDLKLGGADLRRVLEELGVWLSRLHSIPVTGFGYLDSSGSGYRPTFDTWLTESVVTSLPVFEQAGRSVGLDVKTIGRWVDEVVDSFRTDVPRVVLVHNDLLANHVLVHEGRLSGVIDFGEVAAEPAATDFARWDFNEGERFPVKFIRAGYGETSPIAGPEDRSYRALWLATGLWLMQWYHGAGFPPGVEAARDRLLRGPGD